LSHQLSPASHRLTGSPGFKISDEDALNWQSAFAPKVDKLTLDSLTFGRAGGRQIPASRGWREREERGPHRIPVRKTGGLHPAKVRRAGLEGRRMKADAVRASRAGSIATASASTLPSGR
jgi:hypothetical protein